MDKNIIPNNSQPDTQTSPEEDAVLLAIEALEAQTVNPHPKPWTPMPRPIRSPVTPKTTTALPRPAKVIEPVVSHKSEAPDPLPTNAPLPTPPKPTHVKPVTPIPADVKPAVPPPIVPAAPVVPKEPKKPATPAEEMAEALASAPTMSYFQFFLQQKPSHKVLIVIAVVAVILAIVAGIYFFLR